MKRHCIHSGKILEYLDGELSKSGNREFEIHLRSCHFCRQTLSEFRILKRQTPSPARKGVPETVSSGSGFTIQPCRPSNAVDEDTSYTAEACGSSGPGDGYIADWYFTGLVSFQKDDSAERIRLIGSSVIQ